MDKTKFPYNLLAFIYTFPYNSVSMSKDFYSILGISKSASKDEIKSAYRKLSKEFHPDKHKGEKEAEKKYQEINEAYEVLSNDQKRQRYDQFGSADGQQFGGGQGFGGFDFNNMQGGAGGFSDIFESFFGGQGGGRAQKETRGRDIEVELTIDFMDAVKGGTKVIRLTRMRQCKVCDGSGAEPGSSVETCDECKGTGQVTRTMQSFLGTVQQTAICPKCHGSGKVPKHPCKNCNGEGREQITEEVSVDVPAGIHDGQALRVQGAGEAGRQGKETGDLYVHIRITPNRQFIRENDDIRSVFTINVIDALLGTSVKVPTVQGDVTLKIPEGTQPDQVLRIKGKGMPVLNTGRFGDHYVSIAIEIPKSLSKKEKNLLEEWRSLR